MIQGRICDQLTGTKVVLQRAGTKVVLWVCGLLPYYEYYVLLCTEVSLAGGWGCVMCCDVEASLAGG